jgi:hypothetical protein
MIKLLFVFVFKVIKLPEINVVPLTSNVLEGVVVPIPTLPLLLTNKNVFDPLVSVNDPVPRLTLAVTLPVAIWFKLRPTIPEAGMFVSPLPFPWKDPLNEPLKVPFPEDANDELTA